MPAAICVFIKEVREIPTYLLIVQDWYQLRPQFPYNFLEICMEMVRPKIGKGRGNVYRECICGIVFVKFEIWPFTLSLLCNGTGYP